MTKTRAECVDGKPTKHALRKYAKGMKGGRLSCLLCMNKFLCPIRSSMEGGTLECSDFKLDKDFIRIMLVMEEP